VFSFNNDRWRSAKLWVATVLFAACTGNASAAAFEAAGIGDGTMQIVVRIVGSLAGAILAVTTIPPGANDATKNRFMMLLGSAAAGAVSGGVIAAYIAPKLGMDPQAYDVQMLGYGAGSYVIWLLLRFIGRSSAKIQDMDSAISMWGRLMSARDRYREPPPARKPRGRSRG
jgi:hypothetical protein